ncbi:MAG: Metal-dependent hydrolase YbeY, involved in rRNA and/or ribosome maturation and assembly [uncultured Thermomicrobiales bacterium]|uniref:Endoribonuclease YbeY n=1 Tax=uncultured Thermomicrobiales bacterium TaxID=1645740 RepID=A0A6J4V7I3_9BACT|nr:MAG: Metal-dependent hydrolase YbeY, involved in rRNA and/or ribosome maturation and assembly [uncultured Thermomicrobiales bacterium]
MKESAITIAIENQCAAMADEADLRDLVLHTLAAEGIAEPVALTVVLVDDPTIHDLNRRFLDHDEPTDVITFGLVEGTNDEGTPFILPSEEAVRQLGEIYISCERAADQSGEWASDPAREIRFLAIHGVLHLLGWDDATPPERARMLARQEEILDGQVAIGRGSR